MVKNKKILKYGQVATNAVKMIRNGCDPVTAWMDSAKLVFPTQISSRKKGCPRGAFLGLAEEGFIKGVPKGNYTRSRDNKHYAIEAIRLIRLNPNLISDKKGLWQLVSGGNKQHNNQLDVVIGLWNNNDL